jgi:propanol-preferring alcohol dehydrogenase
MRLHAPGERLRLDEVDRPRAGPGDIVIRVTACGVCRTDLHIVDGELPPITSPTTPGHEIVGVVAEVGAGITDFAVGQRVGVPWLGETCGHCEFCRSDHENLCDDPVFTGYTRDGGYAEYASARAAYCLHLPDSYTDVEAAPLLCAGLIGYRSYRRAGRVRTLGLVGFGAAAHIIAQVAKADGVEVYAFTRPGDVEGQRFARDVGARWAGGSDQAPPVPLDAAIIFAPVGSLVPRMLKLVKKGGRVVCAGIHMSDIPGFPYADLWEEREIVSVANLTRDDGREFMARAAQMAIDVTTTAYPLERANEALADLRGGRIAGAAVLVP